MKKLLSLLLALIFILTGCASAPDVTTDTSTTAETILTGNQPVRQRPLVAVSVPTTTETDTADDGTVIFKHTTQHMQLTMADSDVADKVVLDFLNRIDGFNAQAEQLRQNAIAEYNNPNIGTVKYFPYDYGICYEPMRIDQGILSLFGTEISYAGGTHPDYHCVSVNYDLITGETLTLGSILTHENALPSLKALLLAQLNSLKKEAALFDSYKDTINRRFEGEESYDEDWFFTATGLCFYFSPYEIGPYSSGIIQAGIPYEKLTGIMADEFFPAEQESADGSVSVIPLEDADLTAFTQIAELTLDADSNNYLLYTDHGVQDLKIIYTDPNTGKSYTPFAMQQLTGEDAVRLEISEETAKQLTISYRSNGEIVIIPVL